LEAFLQSVRATAERPGRIEVVLVIDADDLESRQVRCDGLELRWVVVPAGLTMGGLNMAGYEASSGRYVMLLNDDVTARTRGWDTRIEKCFESVGDDILLAHVNDHVFEEARCTFPIVSRRYCEMAGGICPRDYVRYRIADHIEDVFNLLGVLGERRSVYLPDVVFEHANFVEDNSKESNPTSDAPRFDALRDSRKELALRMRRYIENARFESEQAFWRHRLENVAEASELRVPERLRVSGKDGVGSSASVTIAVVARDAGREDCRACIDAIRAHTRYRELIVIDHPDKSGGRITTMNRLLRTTASDYLVFVEEDALVGPGWLEALLQSVTPGVAMAAPLHASSRQRQAWCGVAFFPDASGHHGSILAGAHERKHVLSTCGATFLLDVAKCRRFHFDENQRAYFHEIDFGLQLWEAGFEVVCAPTVVTHLGDGSPSYGGTLDAGAFERDRERFAKRWMASGRFATLQRKVWSRYPDLVNLQSMERRIKDVLVDVEGETLPAYHRRVQPLFKELEAIPILRHALLKQATQKLESAGGPALEKLLWARGLCGEPTLVEADWEGFRITLHGPRFYATPEVEEEFDAERYRRGGYRIVFVAEDLEVLKERIRHGLLDPRADAQIPTGLQGLGRTLGHKMAKVRACVGEVGVQGLAKIVCHKTAKGVSRLWRGGAGAK